MNRIQAVLVGGSFVLHVGVGVWMGFLPKEKKTDSVAIALSESKKKKEEAKPPPPPPPPPPAAPPAARAKVAAPAPKPAAEPPPTVNAPPPAAGDAPAAMDGFADLGLAMGGNGMALPGGPGRGAAPEKAAPPATRKVKELAPTADACTEDPVKPQLDHQTQPAYTSEGRQASIEGVVKLEVSVDENGRVTQVRVLKGLGYGLDESAVAAARQWTFKPATKCGKAVSYVVKPGVRFQLGS